MIHPDVEALDYPAIQQLQKQRLADLGQRLAGSQDWIHHCNQHRYRERCGKQDERSNEELPVIAQ